MPTVAEEYVELLGKLFDKNWMPMTFPDQKGRKAHAEPGWYLIRTDTPPEVLERCTKPQETNWVDLAGQTKRTVSLSRLGLAVPFNETGWVVYNGEALNLRQRLREHHHVNNHRTGCLNLGYYPCLHEYQWWSTWAYVTELPGMSALGARESHAVRVCIEQAWRATHGWPRLCDK